MRPPASLPPRLGLDPARMRLPVSEQWRTIRDHVVTRVPLPAGEVDAMFAAGRFHDADGPLPVDAPYVSGGSVWFHRDLPDEAPVPFDVGVVHRDDDVLVADKPHFLATIPRGRHVRETALVRLRDEHGLPELSPAHRLDRVTAGVVLFVVRRERRGAYQNLFRDRRVEKTYTAITRYDPDLPPTTTVRSRITKERGVITAREVPGEPNARDPRRAARAPRRRPPRPDRALPPDPAHRADPPAAPAPGLARCPDPRRPVLPGAARRAPRRLPHPPAAARHDPRLARPTHRRAPLRVVATHAAGLGRSGRVAGG